MDQRLTLVTLGVNNMQKMRAFYEKVFDWKPLEEGNEDVVFYKLNGLMLGLYGRQALAVEAGLKSEGSGFKGFSLACNLRSQDEVDQLFKVLEGRGVNIIKPPQETEWGGYSGYITDPEENLWEIAYNPFWEYDEKGNVL